ncbi:unnamed protein product [Menidia menidia]|uniref:(Atlantic silverside) hypothetical protein n=1 Tax=Menidia menidia TaxID=238744 RepID=A0A8S4ACG6_9TELE|nr:unnamed protein product [Menidia menidia]
MYGETEKGTERKADLLGFRKVGVTCSFLSPPLRYGGIDGAGAASSIHKSSPVSCNSPESQELREVQPLGKRPLSFLQHAKDPARLSDPPPVPSSPRFNGKPTHLTLMRMQQHPCSHSVALLLAFLAGTVVCGPPTLHRSRVRRQNMKVRISATGDTIVMKFLRPNSDIKLEGYILGYGSSMFSKQFIQLPENNGQPYETEFDAEPKYLIAVQPIPSNEVKKQCTGKVELEKPLHLVIGSVTPTSVLLSWGTLLKTPYEGNIMNECLEDGHYMVRYREKNRKWNYQTCPTSDTVIDNLKPNTVYEFGVQPNTKDGTGVWSKPVIHNISMPSVEERVVRKILKRPHNSGKPLTPGPHSFPYSPQHVPRNWTRGRLPFPRNTVPQTTLAPRTAAKQEFPPTPPPRLPGFIKKQPIGKGHHYAFPQAPNLNHILNLQLSHKLKHNISKRYHKHRPIHPNKHIGQRQSWYTLSTQFNLSPRSRPVLGYSLNQNSQQSQELRHRNVSQTFSYNPGHNLHQRRSSDPNSCHTPNLGPVLNLGLGSILCLRPGSILIATRVPQGRQCLRVLALSDHPLLEFLILPIAHLQQEETSLCLAQGLLLIPLILVSDHSLHPRLLPPLKAPTHLAYTCSPHSATCAWCTFYTFTTGCREVSRVRVVNMIYGPTCRPANGVHHRGNALPKPVVWSKGKPAVLRNPVPGNKRPNLVGKPNNHDKPMNLKQGDKESILKPFTLVTAKPKQDRRQQTTTAVPAVNSSRFDINENSSIFRPLPASEVDIMGKKRFVAPHVIYKTDKKPDEPCSITSSLAYFPDDEFSDQNVTGPPRTAPSNLTVVTVEGCPSFVILDWEKTDNETTEYEVVSTTTGPNGQEVSILTTNQTHTAVENLTPESSYEFKVTPKNELGSGPSSDPVTFSTESGKFPQSICSHRSPLLRILESKPPTVQIQIGSDTTDPRVSEHASGKDAIWTQFPFKSDAYSECNGKQYVKRTWYRKFVGIQLCNSLRYKIYLSDSLTGKFYNIGDQTGHGEDHCQFVDSFLDGRTGTQMLADQLPSRTGFFRAMRQEPVSFGEIGGKSHATYVGWYECGTPIPGKW